MGHESLSLSPRLGDWSAYPGFKAHPLQYIEWVCGGRKANLMPPEAKAIFSKRLERRGWHVHSHKTYFPRLHGVQVLRNIRTYNGIMHKSLSLTPCPRLKSVCDIVTIHGVAGITGYFPPLTSQGLKRLQV